MHWPRRHANGAAVVCVVWIIKVGSGSVRFRSLPEHAHSAADMAGVGGVLHRLISGFCLDDQPKHMADEKYMCRRRNSYHRAESGALSCPTSVATTRISHAQILGILSDVVAPPSCLRPLRCCPKGSLRDNSRGDDPLDRVTHICGSAIREPHHLYIFQVLRHARVPAQFLARRGARLRADSRHPHL